MCGIAGFQGRFEAELLDRMNDIQRHRGPDDAGLYRLPDKQVGLAHRRLSIIDLSPTGHQPMHDAAGQLTIVYNGEIYNYRELRRELEANGCRFRSQSDTEVLLQLYLTHGPEMLGRLNGIFAFGLWDDRSDTLFLARDGLGVKPLYFAELEPGFAFASEIKALLQCGELSRELDPVAVQHYLTYLWCPAPRTMLAAVRKLPPGHALTVQDGRITKQWSFYDLPYGSSASRGTDAAAAVQQVQQDLRTAVERQLVADVPVGAFLSGGLDSSAVVAFARRALGSRRLQCFTIGFRDDAMVREGFAEDLPYARRVAKHLDVDLHTIYVGPEMADQLETMIYHLDEPQADPAPINVLFISQLARENGIKVLLSGAGGDDIFAGYRRHHALLRERTWSWLPRAGRRGLTALSASLPTTTPLGRRLRKAFQYADCEGDRRVASYFAWVDPQRLASLYGERLRPGLARLDALSPMLESLDRLGPDVMPLDRMLYLEGKHFLADHNLNYTDKMGMAKGVEIRVPLLDVDLVRTAAGLAPRFKQRGREGKWVFKKAMEPYLPRDVVYRSKTGFGAPLRHWLRGPLRPLINELLSESALAKRGLFDPRGVGRLVRDDQAGRVDAAYTIFAVLCVELWCRIFLESHRPAPTAV